MRLLDGDWSHLFEPTETPAQRLVTLVAHLLWQALDLLIRVTVFGYMVRILWRAVWTMAR